MKVTFFQVPPLLRGGDVTASCTQYTACHVTIDKLRLRPPCLCSHQPPQTPPFLSIGGGKYSEITVLHSKSVESRIEKPWSSACCRLNEQSAECLTCLTGSFGATSEKVLT